MPGHPVMPVARSPGGSQSCERSPTVAHALRAVPQPCPLLPDHLPQAHRAQLVVQLPLRLCDSRSQDAPGTAGRLQHRAHKACYRGLAQTSMQDLKNGAPGRSWNQTPLNFGAA